MRIRTARFVYLFFIAIFLFTQNCHAIYPLPTRSASGMVVAEQYLAAKIGAAILEQGGNAIDAAVATGYALAVTYPCCGNIGGGGFMLIHLAKGQDIFINFREKAPLKAHANMFLDKKGNPISSKSLRGFAATAVPGTVLGLDQALQRYGTMTRSQVMQPAIQLAKEGFVLTENDIARLELINFTALAPNALAIFSKNGKPLQSGDKLVQSNLANVLTAIAKEGSDVFYKGFISDTIVKASEQYGGYLSRDDFANYTIQELTPLVCTYRGYKIITAPPPSSGGVTLCEMLGILEGYDLNRLGYHSSQSLHYIIEAMRYAFADRNSKLGDPDFVKNPVQELISKKYTQSLRENIQDYQKTPSQELPLQPTLLESTNTTHYSIADKAGNLVAVTYTLNSMFGAEVIAGDTGFFLNNEMNDFTIKAGAINQFGLKQGEQNNIQPGKRPLSSMTPTLIFYQEKPFLVLGSPGGPRIITALLQTILNMIDYKMDVRMAIDEPRIHQQWWPELVDAENHAISRDTLEKLASMGYRFRVRKPWGRVEAIFIDLQGVFWGANDDREPGGLAVGP